jgi:polar amino acid transport system substrate-binding protein
MNRRYAIKLGCAIVVSASVLFGTPSLADPRMADLVQAGKVRVALFLPLYTSDPRTGELRGSGPGIVAIEVARGLAAHIGIEALLVGHPTPPKVLECLKAGDCDVAVMGIEPSRAAEVSFSPPFVQLDYTFLVPADSSIRSIADADRPGIRIAVVRNHASTLALSRVLKHAKLVYADTPDPTFDLLRTKQADVMASPRIALVAYSTKLPGSRVLDDRYGANLVGLAVPKGQAGRLAYVSEFIEEAKSSGLIQRAIERAGLPGIEVAPPGKAIE